MFRKALLSIALLAVLFTSLAPVHAEAAAPLPIGQTLTGYIVALKPTGEITIASLLPSQHPLKVMVDNKTVIRLGQVKISFSELRVGDFVNVTLRPASSLGSKTYWAQLIDVTRTPNFDTASH